MTAKIHLDIYRVNLFKKKLREILDAPWVRFYYSKGRCHLCLEAWHIGKNNVPIAMQILKKNRIDFKVSNWSDVCEIFGNEIRSINIPIDQDALPERKRK